MLRLKNAEQILGIRESCRLLSRMFAELRPRVQVGVATQELDDFARDYIQKADGRPAFLGYNGYPASLCVSVNEEVIHGIPGPRRLREGDIVGIDCGIDLAGFFSDAAITVPVGRVSPKVSALLDTTRECLARAIAAIRVGGRIHDISRAVYGLASDRGYGVVRQWCGHGVGFSPHEDPQVPNYVSSGPNPRIVPGMVLAIEPMINLGAYGVETLDDGWTVVTADRLPSAHYEHTVAILPDGPEVLTSW
ncbi:MAG TPA: type I methionyl aminopeptidase [Magnetospirillaceae bacterium]|nr:type I methionyl aminopeptidase [Magnetospirillaceae bacterium]